MLIICNGMPRSASTWSVHAVLGLLQHAYPGAPVHKGYSQNLVQFVKSSPPEVRHIVIKSHTLTPLTRTMLAIGALKVIFTWRDLADAAASAMQTFGRNEETFLDFYRSFDVALELLAFHRANGHALLLEYAALQANPAAAIRTIANYLDLPPLPETAFAQIAAATSIDESRRAVSVINARPNVDLIETGRSWYDPDTLYHRNHINDGRSGKGRELLTPDQWQQLETLCAKHGFPNLTLTPR